MNRNCYRLVFNTTAGMMVPLAEIARGRGKAASSSVLVGALLANVILANVMLANAVQPKIPVASAGGAIPNFVTYGQAAYQSPTETQAFINQVGNKSILNWQSFNISAGSTVQFRQVDSLATNNLVPGASFTSLNRIWDNNPSVISGVLSQAAGQNANVILVNTNGIAFMGGSQVNLNSFTASSLNIKDTFILDSLFPGDRLPQFEGTGGFIKVFEGAKISAGNSGRVMLIAPTVVNKGKIEAPDGQVILAAGNKVYLRASGNEDTNVRGLLVEVDSPAALNDFSTVNTSVKDGQLDDKTVPLTNPAQDFLGHATNLGELSTPRGNVTMVGYAVNQQGIARATTSVVVNGSIYLQAKDRAFTSGGTLDPAGAQRGGRVTLGEQSLTEVQPEVADTTTAVDGTGGTGLEKSSQVKVLGQDIRMAGGAVINVPSGEVSMIAVDAPGTLNSTTSIYSGNSAVSNKARIHIASGARINVAGLDNVQVEAARNSIEVELRGDELKDSPVNQQGPLRGEKAYLDINRAMANSKAGKSTLIAKDSLESYQGRLARTVAERSTAGGNVAIHSQGEAIVEAGAVIDLSGGSTQYTPGMVNTTLLAKGGVLTDLADANAETRYDGIATRYVVDYKKWNQQEVINLPQSQKYEAGYTEGKNAGSLGVFGMQATYMQAGIQGRTTVGQLQRDAVVQPAGARLTLGFDDTTKNLNEVNNLSVKTRDYKLNQNVEVNNEAARLAAGFKFGDALPDEIKNTLTVNANLLGKDKIASLNVFSNQAVTVRNALRTPQGGSVSIVGSGVTVNANVEAIGGSINLAARNTANTVPETLAGSLPDPQLRIADGVTLSARGAWVNDALSAPKEPYEVVRLNGGTIALSAESQASSGAYIAQGSVTLGQNTLLDASSGAQVKADGKVVGGDGGAVSVSAFAVTGVDHNVQAFGVGKGGKITLASNRIKVGGAPEVLPGSLHLDPGFFERGGFADFNLTALDKLTIAEGTEIRPTVKNLELLPAYRLAPTGSNIQDFAGIVKQDDRVRQVANLTLAAKQKDVGTGDLLIEQGARIIADPKAKVSLEARNKIEILGSVMAAGGTISALLDRSDGQVNGPVNVNSIWLGRDAVLDVSGKALTYLDSRGLTQGQVLNGGAINLNAKTGYVVTESGSRIDVSGAAPVRIDVTNERGGLGRMVGSDAGSLTVFVEEGALLDGNMAARAGGVSNRGGKFDLTLSKYVAPTDTTPAQPNISLALAQTVAPQVAGLTSGAAIPNGDVVRVRLGTDKLEAAGFDRIALASRDAIELENGLNLGANRAVSLRDVKLDAARIQTKGGFAALTAETLHVGNYDPTRLGGTSTVTDAGTLTLSARQLELAGKLRLEGMARAELNGLESISLAGVTTGIVRPTGGLSASADLVFEGAVVAPTTYTEYAIAAPQHTVTFRRDTDNPTQPLSAQGSLAVAASHIVQGGNLWAPFGQINLVADESLTLQSGSLTSVAALPGSLIPFGKVVNGRSWIYDADSANVPAGQLPQAELGGKVIRTSGKIVDMQAGAKVNLAGGGDLQAYEFTVGPGGSRDILAGANTYAILPGYAGGVAPSDIQEAKGFNRSTGDSVYLSGVSGLADGVYTLLPAHYALLPGAFAVRLDTGVKSVMPGQSYDRQDGVRIAAGYLTDSRTNAPKDANWSGVEVLTNAQVRARSEFTLTRASDFFATGKNRPQDAGLLSIATTGISGGSMKLDATYQLAAGAGGHGAALDISAQNLALVSGTPSGIDPNATQLDVGRLNAMGASSLLVGGTRSTNGDITTLTMGANAVTIANDASHALTAAEIILAAKDTLTLKSGSLVDAQGEAGNAGGYVTAGEGALVRVAATSATLERAGSPGNSKGTLVAEIGTKLKAADSITLDATKDNTFKGTVEFSKNGVTVPGNLAVGASRVSFGAAPAGTAGITYSQADLDGLNSLKGLALTSYSTFDLYGDVSVGGLNGNGKPTLQSLTLQGAGLAGLDNSGKTANLRAKNLTLANPAAVSFIPGGTMGDGALAIVAETLTLGDGDKAIKGYGHVSITANEMVGKGAGVGANAGKTANTNIAAPTTISVARISGGVNSNQTLTSSGALMVASRAADSALAPVTTLGAKWAMAGASVDFDTRAELSSGQFTLNATGGNVALGADASVDLAGRAVGFFDVTKPTWGGSAQFTSDTGSVSLASGAKVDVSAAPGADGGTLKISAANGTVMLGVGSVQGAARVDAGGKRGDGARVDVDVNTLTSFSALNSALNQGGFDGERKVRIRSGDVSVVAGDTTRAQTIRIAADSGTLNVAGQLDASGDAAGRIELFAKNDVNIQAGAKLDAFATGTGKGGGDIEIGTSVGNLDLALGSALNVAGGNGGDGGKVLLRAPRTGGGAGTGVAVSALKSTIAGARSVAVEGIQLYNGITTLTQAGASTSTSESLAKINSDNAAFAVNFANIKTNLGKTADPGFHILSGVEVRSAGDLTLSDDWNLDTARAGGEAGVLTLRAAGNLKLEKNLSDGFSLSIPCTPASTCATAAALRGTDSWSYRLIAGADSAAADPLAVKAATNGLATDVLLAAGKLVRTGTGDIRIASGRNIELKDNKSVIYTAGRVADAVSGFVTPAAVLKPVFAQGGGDVSLTALGDIVGKPSAQLYSEWLYRQGAVNLTTGAYTQQPAWWVRFDQFQQGVGALGGGDVTLYAGGNVKDISASTPTQGRTTGLSPELGALTVTGGGDLRIQAGGDVLGGQYYAGRSELVIKAGGKIGRSDQNLPAAQPLDPLIALGDARAKLQALKDATISNVLNPHLLVQATGNLATSVGVTARRSLFSSYGVDSGVDIQSLAGKVALTEDSAAMSSAFTGLLNSVEGKKDNQFDLAYVLPSALSLTAFQSSVAMGTNTRNLTMSPAADSNLSLLAADSIKLNSVLSMSDRDAVQLPSPLRPVSVNTSTGILQIPKLIVDLEKPTAMDHAATPVHTGDTVPARVYAASGDVQGYYDSEKEYLFSALNLPKALRVRAGRDVRDLGVIVQHISDGDLSLIEAGRDVLFSGIARRDNAKVWIGGPGRLEVTAGRNVDLGTSAGITSRGDLDNSNLPRGGANIQILAGAGPQGLDATGAINRLIGQLENGAVDEPTLWLARWLTGNNALNVGNALAGVRAVAVQDAQAQRNRVRELVFTALRTTGRDHNEGSSAFAGDYSRGYAALELVFPGMGQKNPDGSFKNYQGNVNLFASRIKTERDGNIEFMIPGGELIVGLANTPDALVNPNVLNGNVLGMVAAGQGDIKGFARGNMRVNQSRVLTVGGGDVFLWSSEGDIDAGKGKKTASAVPPPITNVDDQGNVTQVLQGAVTGSGIGALSSGGVKAGDVDLIAPKGTVNAGDAGIRAGNLNIAAAVVQGADNISVSGKSSGTPVADTSAVSATASGATTGGDDLSKTTAALSQSAADSAKNAQALKDSFKPSFVRVDVLGFGE